MKKTFNISSLFIISFLFACTYSEPIHVKSIKIKIIDQHPFLVDHCKNLVIVNKKDKVIDSENLYCDPGSGCNSFLFDTYKTYTLIDCNGCWYEIEKQTGKIIKTEWKWNQKLPETYIGTYQRPIHNKEYILTKDSTLTIDKVYQFKDPEK